MSPLICYEHGIHAFDAGYVRPMLAAVHLVVENGRAAFVDTGTNASLPSALAALEVLGLTPDCVDYVILTHIHLDHAGGAGAMMRQFPRARLVVHPRGARHMADPSRLVAGANAVYGADEVSRLYGDVLPIDQTRIIEATHGLKVDLAGREFVCLDTPGHARHHNCIVDRRSGHIFTGDTFGLSYRELDTDGRQFIFPTSTPSQFEPQALKESIDLLMTYRPQAMYLTHFSQVKDVDAKARDLHRLIDAYLDIARREENAGPERQPRIRNGLAQLLIDETTRFGCRLPHAEILEIFAMDLELNAQGLVVWLDGQR
ncbi:MAG: MBL fold metallo-hydrolase [Propionivibrio sp.]|uniref:MBL fold metallo-hydrolase n=1 Tax=Propionivibrio sp. TaxID=2212460 RepID=UPI0025D6EFA2|nr:MBL fold metallo-hydrolase [Propionivibrio sp.]MBL0208816.1 MBL fold metallo-hydrolase [Propionivibrio sp.]